MSVERTYDCGNDYGTGEWKANRELKECVCGGRVHDTTENKWNRNWKRPCCCVCECFCCFTCTPNTHRVPSLIELNCIAINGRCRTEIRVFVVVAVQNRQSTRSARVATGLYRYEWLAFFFSVSLFLYAFASACIANGLSDRSGPAANVPKITN